MLCESEDGVARLQQILLVGTQHLLDMAPLLLCLVSGIHGEEGVGLRLVFSHHELLLVELSDENALGSEDVVGATLLSIMTNLDNGEWDAHFLQLCDQSRVEEVVLGAQSLRAILLPLELV